jgi:hypothetical protein
MNGQIVYGTPEKLQDGRYFVSASCDSGPIFVTLRDVAIGEIRDDMVLTLSNVGDVQEIDNVVINAAEVNSSAWFSKNISRETLVNYYQSSLEDSVLQVVPNLNSKGKVNVALFGQNKEVIKTVEPGTVCTVLVQFDGLWFLKRSFGPVWKLVQARVKKEIQPVECIIRDEDSD